MLLDHAELERASALCGAAGVWLIVDNTYEHFTYDGGRHTCVEGPHVINIFSFSKVLSRFSFSLIFGCNRCPARQCFAHCACAGPSQ